MQLTPVPLGLPSKSLVETTGTVPFTVGEETFETWYRIFGDLATSTQPPVLVLHGGPGIIHDYMLPLADLANNGDRAVIFYDQLGNGHSTHLRHKPKEFWTIDLFISELINLSEKLNISSRYVLAGHSWGGILGLELLLRRPPPGLLSYVCLSGLASIPRYMEEYNKLLSKFPKEVQEGMGMQKTDMKRFREANDRFDEVHTIQVVPFPKEHVDSMDSIWGPEADDTVIEHLFANELTDWDIIGRMRAIDKPVLLINGRMDKITDYVLEPIFFEIPKIRWITMDKSSHMPFWEERERFTDLVDKWLRASPEPTSTSSTETSSI